MILQRLGQVVRFWLTVIPLALLWVSPLSSQSADPIWRFNTGGRIRSRPAVAPDGTIYALSEDRHLYALTEDGVFKWRYWLKERVWDSITVGTDGTIFTVTKRGTIIAMNAGGKELWRARVDAAPSGDPAVDTRGRVYVGTINGGLSCFSYRGDLLWQAEVPSSIAGSPVLTRSGLVVVPCLDDRLYAYTSWGVKVWEALLAGVPVSPALSADGTIYAGTSYGSLVALDQDGTILWDYVTGSSSLNPVITEDGVFAAFSNGAIAMLDADGTLIWEDTIGVPLSGFVSVGSGGIIHLFSSGGRLILIGSEGTYLGGSVGGVSGRYVLSRQGTLLVGEDDWLVYGYESLSEEDTDWPQAGAGPSHRGMAGRYVERDMDLLYGQSMDYLYFRHLSRSDDVDDRISVLSEIEQRLEQSTGEMSDEYLTFIVGEVMAAGVLSTITENKRTLEDFPLARVKAATILGKYGDLHNRTQILEVLVQEPDSTAASYEMAALGAIGSDADGNTVAAIARRVYADDRSTPDPGLAMAAIGALKGIRAYHGVLPEPAVELLFHLYRGKYPKSVRDGAMDVLRGK